MMTRREVLRMMGAGFGTLGLSDLLRSQRSAGSPLGAEAAAFPAKGEARHLLCSSTAGRRRSTRSTPSRCSTKYHGKPVPSGNLQDRAQDRQPAEIAFRVQEVRQERHRGQRDFSASIGELHRRLLRHPLDVHGPAEPRAVAVHDELRRPAARAGRRWVPGSLTGWAPKTRICPASSCCVRACRWSARSSGLRPFCPAVHQGTYIPNNETDPEKLIQYIRNHEISPRRAAPPARPAGQAEPAAHATAKAPTRSSKPASNRMEIAFRMQTEAPEAFDITQGDREPRARVTAIATSDAAA